MKRRGFLKNIGIAVVGVGATTVVEAKDTWPNLSENKEDSMDNQLVKWHILNAGLILTHPFLNHLFNSLEYLNLELKFKDEASKWRAVYLLHYLATGNNDEVGEVELAISKILCGMEINEPIPKKIALNNEEKEMAEELLTVLINRWERLGQTSVEGLRGTFLIREGLLEKQEGAYLLAMETTGVDILLDFIPWNISLIKLPWLNTIIYTTWR